MHWAGEFAHDEPTKTGHAMKMQLGRFILAFAFIGTGCAGSGDFETGTTSPEKGTLLAGFSEEDGRSFAIYRAPGNMLLVEQETPAFSTPLVTAEMMSGRLPSEVFSELTGEAPSAALLDAEQEFATERAPVVERLPAASSEELGQFPETATQASTAEAPMYTRSHDPDVDWFKQNFCNTIDIRAGFVPAITGEETFKAVPSRVTADRLITRTASWGYVAGFNMGSSGNIVTKTVIDVEFGASNLTTPRTVNWQHWFAGWRETCSWGGCFKVPLQRTFTQGIAGFSPGEVGATCVYMAK
jgi:hypothetical protein